MKCVLVLYIHLHRSQGSFATEIIKITHIFKGKNTE